jgi:hypothetical protein
MDVIVSTRQRLHDGLFAIPVELAVTVESVIESCRICIFLRFHHRAVAITAGKNSPHGKMSKTVRRRPKRSEKSLALHPPKEGGSG